MATVIKKYTLLYKPPLEPCATKIRSKISQAGISQQAQVQAKWLHQRQSEICVNFWWCRGRGSDPWLWEQTSKFPLPVSAQVSMAVRDPVLGIWGWTKKSSFTIPPHSTAVSNSCISHFCMLAASTDIGLNFQAGIFLLTVSSLYQAANFFFKLQFYILSSVW